MTKTPPNVSQAVRAFMASQGIPPEQLRADGRLTLNIDQAYRIHLQSSSHDRVAITSQLLSLAGVWHQPSVDGVLDTLAQRAAGMLKEHPSSLCLDERNQALLLQQFVPADADASVVQDALADFVNALAFWKPTCSGQAHLVAA